VNVVSGILLTGHDATPAKIDLKLATDEP